jgi:hypothetical protein
VGTRTKVLESCANACDGGSGGVAIEAGSSLLLRGVGGTPYAKLGLTKGVNMKKKKQKDLELQEKRIRKAQRALRKRMGEAGIEAVRDFVRAAIAHAKSTDQKI